MAVKIDYLLQDCEALMIAVGNHRSAMEASGFTEANYTAFTDAKANLIAKELAQQNAVKLVNDKTKEQDEAIRAVADLIRRIKSAAKSAYGKDERNLALFKIGDAVPTSVKKLRTVCEYTAALVLEKSELLKQNGLTQEDIDALNSSYGTLVAVDASQENAKKMQVAATLAREEAAKKLKDRMFRIRNFAKACFAKNKEILVEFKPVPKGGGGKTKTTVEETPVEQPAS